MRKRETIQYMFLSTAHSVTIMLCFLCLVVFVFRNARDNDMLFSSIDFCIRQFFHWIDYSPFHTDKWTIDLTSLSSRHIQSAALCSPPHRWCLARTRHLGYS